MYGTLARNNSRQSTEVTISAQSRPLEGEIMQLRKIKEQK